MANTRTAAKTSGRRKATEEALIPEEATEVAADVLDYLKEYAREKPEVAALWCLGIGFVLGWKLKPW
jgi:hypothetical protein